MGGEVTEVRGQNQIRMHIRIDIQSHSQIQKPHPSLREEWGTRRVKLWLTNKSTLW
jgi:hypothetical protein